MNDYESNCIVIRSILGSCLSDINKLMLLWNYGIILPEAAEECCLCSLSNLTLVELKQILEACGLITIIIILLSLFVAHLDTEEHIVGKCFF